MSYLVGSYRTPHDGECSRQGNRYFCNGNQKGVSTIEGKGGAAFSLIRKEFTTRNEWRDRDREMPRGQKAKQQGAPLPPEGDKGDRSGHGSEFVGSEYEGSSNQDTGGMRGSDPSDDDGPSVTQDKTTGDKK